MVYIPQQREAVESASERNKNRLRGICDKMGCTRISFYVHPAFIISPDAAIAEAANGLERFYQDKINGRAKPELNARY